MYKKKKFKLQLKIEESKKAEVADCFEAPGNKKVDHARKPKEYYQDQLKHDEDKKLKIELLRKKQQEKEKNVNKYKPNINKVFKGFFYFFKKSKKLATKKNEGMAGDKIYGRLAKEHLHKETKQTEKQKTVIRKVFDPKTKKEILVEKPIDKQKNKLVRLKI